MHMPSGWANGKSRPAVLAEQSLAIGQEFLLLLLQVEGWLGRGGFLEIKSQRIVTCVTPGEDLLIDMTLKSGAICLRRVIRRRKQWCFRILRAESG